MQASILIAAGGSAINAKSVVCLAMLLVEKKNKKVEHMLLWWDRSYLKPQSQSHPRAVMSLDIDINL